MKKHSKMFLVFSFLFLAIVIGAAFAAEDKPWTDKFFSEFNEIKTRLANVEAKQQEIAAKDQEILEKLDQLRIWVRRK